jgi:hypothetical protein
LRVINGEQDSDAVTQQVISAIEKRDQ